MLNNTKYLLYLVFSLCFSQAIQDSLRVSRVYDIRNQAAIDNRSETTKRMNLHTFQCTGSGTWSCQLQYSDSSISGPWSSYTESSSLVNQSSTNSNGSGFGYHDFIRIYTTGTVTKVDYAGMKDVYLNRNTQSLTSNVNWLTEVDNKPVIDIREYGADSTGVADSTTALTTAQATCTAGCVILFPTGTYRISSQTFTDKNSVMLVGAGRGATKLMMETATATDGLRWHNTGTGEHNGVRDLTIDLTNGSATMEFSIVASRQRYFTVKNVEILSNYKGVGAISLFDCFFCTAEDVNIWDLKFLTGVGIFLNQDTETPDQFINRVYIDSHAPCGYNCEPLAGILVNGSGGFYITHSDIIHAGNGLLVAPGIGQYVMWSHVGQSFFDQCATAGINIVPSGNGIVKGLQFIGTWASTSGTGIRVQQSGSTTVDGVSFNGVQAYNNLGNGLESVGIVKNISVTNSKFSQNTVDYSGVVNTSGTTVTRVSGDTFNTPMGNRTITINSVAYTISQVVSSTQLLLTGSAGAQTGVAYTFNATGGAGISVGAASDGVVIANNTSGQINGFRNTQGFGAYVTAGATNVSIRGNDFRNNLTLPVANAATAQTVSVVGNMGVDDVIPTIASGTTMQPTAPVIFISGTGAIDTLTLPVTFTGSFTAIPTGVFTWTTSGNIAASGTAVVNKPVTFTYVTATSKWYASY